MLRARGNGVASNTSSCPGSLRGLSVKVGWGQEKGIVSGSRAKPSQVLMSHRAELLERFLWLPESLSSPSFLPGFLWSGSRGQCDAEDKGLGVDPEVQVTEIPAGTGLGMVLSPPSGAQSHRGADTRGSELAGHRGRAGSIPRAGSPFPKSGMCRGNPEAWS